MDKVTLPGTQLAVSRFIFGTGSLFSAGSPAKRAALLDAAVDHGFTHFDTAPYYAHGLAERDLAGLCRRHPHVTVTTKVGLYPAGGGRQGNLQVLARKAGGKLLPGLSRPTSDFSLARARRALDASLSRLGRADVDLYLLHDPQIEMVDIAAWVDWLQGEQRAGRIGAFGLACDDVRLRPFLQAGGPLTRFIQTTDSMEGREADAVVASGRPLQITYGYVSAARRDGSTEPVPTILSQALARNRDGAVIVSTTKAERLKQYPAVAAAAAAR